MIMIDSASHDSKMVQCDFCGHKFDAGCATQTCNSCPMVSNCGQLACPNCGYPVLREPTLIRLLRGIKVKVVKSTHDAEAS